MDPLVPTILIPSSCAVGMLFAVFLWLKVAKVKVAGHTAAAADGQNGRAYLLEEEQRGDDEVGA